MHMCVRARYVRARSSSQLYARDERARVWGIIAWPHCVILTHEVSEGKVEGFHQICTKVYETANYATILY